MTDGAHAVQALQILFIQGGGADVHDEWDDKLVDSLRRELGAGYEVRYPRMPDEGDPSYARWSTAIRREVADLDDGAVVVGHSVGAAILINAFAEQRPAPRLGAIVLIAAPFVGEGGWPGDEFELSSDLGARLPRDVPVVLFHGLDDDTAPPAHADLYAAAIAQAQVHRLPGKDHQLHDDLRDVAREIAKTVAERIAQQRVGSVRLRHARAVRHTRATGELVMSYAVDFGTVSTVGLESSPHADALAGLRANEARYFKNKYDHVFTVEPATKAKATVAWVHRILEQERDIVISSKPLEATEFEVENIRMAYVFYESGLSINVMYTLEDAKKRAVGFKLSDGMEIPEELSKFKFARQKSELAGTIRGSYFVIKGEY
jgi:predicted alpha/beta hydrolase family esterase